MDVLTDHPQLTPNIVQVLSNALTASQQQVRDLERRLERAEATSTGNVHALSIANAEVARFRELYEKERDSGRDLRTTLEERFIDLRTKETAVGHFQQIVEDKMDEYTERATKLTLATAAKMEALQIQLGVAKTETSELKQDISTKDDALFMLAKANQYLEENLRTSKDQNTELSFKINQLTNDLAAVHAKTTEFAQCVQTHEATMMELQAKLDTNTTHTTATEAAHLLLESEMQKLLAKQAASDEDLKAKQLELDAKAADVATAQDALEALRDEAHAQNARVDEERAGAVDVQRRMEAQISELEAEAAVLRKNAADSDKEISRLRLRDGERGALEEAVIAKAAELRALRDQSDIMVAGLEEDLRVAVTTAENVATQNVRLKENMKIQLLQLSELLKKRDNLVVKAKADLVKQSEEAEAERSILVAKLDSVQAAYTDLKTLSDAQETKELSQRKEAQAQDRARIKALEESNEKLEATNKNLRSSVFAAAKHTEQELQKGSEIQRGKLEGELRAAKSLNDKLQEDLHAVHQKFLKLLAERSNLLEKIKRLSETPPRTFFERIRAPPTLEPHEEPKWFESRHHRDESSESKPSMDEDEDQTESGDEQQESEVDERLLYHKFMMNFGRPAGRPSFKDLQPIHKLASKYSTTLEVSTQDLPTTRRTLYCPKRTLWCGGQHLHALVFAPTQEYWYSTDSWTDKTKMRAYCGETFEFFVNQAGFTYYAGAYVVHSLRDVHPPGSIISTDVSRLAIHRATGLSQNHADKVKECYPDGEIKTECFGLQCVGFNQAMYRTLRERFTGASGVADRKRKAGSEELRGEGGKSQRVF